MAGLASAILSSRCLPPTLQLWVNKLVNQVQRSSFQSHNCTNMESPACAFLAPQPFGPVNLWSCIVRHTCMHLLTCIYIYISYLFIDSNVFTHVHMNGIPYIKLHIYIFIEMLAIYIYIHIFMCFIRFHFWFTSTSAAMPGPVVVRRQKAKKNKKNEKKNSMEELFKRV